MKISGVYKIQSIAVPERCYIGSAANISVRWYYHRWSLEKNKHSSIKLQRHYNKYGKADLIYSILLGCEATDLIQNEQFFIDAHNPWFNIRKIADSNLGLRRSEESRNKMSQARKGEKHTAEHNQKISNALKGRIFSEESIQKMRIAQKGRVTSDEAKRKIGIANTGKKKTEEEKEAKRLRMLNFKHTEESKLKMRCPRSDDFKEKIRKSWIKRKLKTTKN